MHVCYTGNHFYFFTFLLVKYNIKKLHCICSFRHDNGLFLSICSALLDVIRYTTKIVVSVASSIIVVGLLEIFDHSMGVPGTQRSQQTTVTHHGVTITVVTLPPRHQQWCVPRARLQHVLYSNEAFLAFLGPLQYHEFHRVPSVDRQYLSVHYPNHLMQQIGTKLPKWCMTQHRRNMYISMHRTFGQLVQYTFHFILVLGVQPALKGGQQWAIKSKEESRVSLGTCSEQTITGSTYMSWTRACCWILDMWLTSLQTIKGEVWVRLLSIFLNINEISWGSSSMPYTFSYAINA